MHKLGGHPHEDRKNRAPALCVKLSFLQSQPNSREKPGLISHLQKESTPKVGAEKNRPNTQKTCQIYDAKGGGGVKWKINHSKKCVRINANCYGVKWRSIPPWKVIRERGENTRGKNVEQGKKEKYFFPWETRTSCEYGRMIYDLWAPLKLNTLIKRGTSEVS